MPRLALVTGDFRDQSDLARRARLALEGGVRWVQLRAKQLGGRALYESATMLRALTRDFEAMLIVNDRVDIALAAGADGVHLPGSGLAVTDTRRLVGERLLIGTSVHSRAEIEAADPQVLDYVQFGPVYDTPSKRAFGNPQGIAALAEAAQTARRSGLLLVAIGGAGPLHAPELAGAGAGAVAAIGAIWNAADVRTAAQEFVAAAEAAFARCNAAPAIS